MTAEEIVRKLVEDPPIASDEEWHWCAICDVTLPMTPGDHMIDCPYRLAVEWVALQP